MSQQTGGDDPVRDLDWPVMFVLTLTKSFLRNFVSGALVMVADRRAGRGVSAIHKLDSITDRRTNKFRGINQSGIPTKELTLEPGGGVYIYNCSNM